MRAHNTIASHTGKLILSRLDKVRQTGESRWMACCPAHEDRDPSLSIKVTDDKVLIYCHAGCDTRAVLEAIGMTWGELFQDEPYRSATKAAATRVKSVSDNSVALAIATLTVAVGHMVDLGAFSERDEASILGALEVLRP